MTRYVMVADLRRCVGCQACTAACKEANGTPIGVQWRRVLDIEVGEFPDVKRIYVPTGCQHCADPPCMDVCPTTATGQRADGIVTIDYDLCIGCAYCAVACPYEARYRADHPKFSFGEEASVSERARFDSGTIGVATKCTFCADRIDGGCAKGLVPGRDPDATPVCVNTCISSALAFGDIEDPDSNVSQLLAENKWFRMHEDAGTSPGFYYLWDKELS
jgi:phenylacetyl-CoA:acceptor oxidoreductase subunit 1